MSSQISEQEVRDAFSCIRCKKEASFSAMGDSTIRSLCSCGHYWQVRFSARSKKEWKLIIQARLEANALEIAMRTVIVKEDVGRVRNQLSHSKVAGSSSSKLPPTSDRFEQIVQDRVDGWSSLPDDDFWMR